MPSAANCLNKILREEPDLRIVISSTWRLYKDLSVEMFTRLKEAGLYTDRIIDVTPALKGERGDEIQAWLALHPDIQYFVIIDDDEDMGRLKDHLVKCNRKVGFTRDRMKFVYKKLKLRRNWEIGENSPRTAIYGRVS